MDHSDTSVEQTAPVWTVFGDLMSGLLGAFVLLLVGALASQLELASHLETEVQKRQIEEQRRISLEKALAIPLASGRITLQNGRIGISGPSWDALPQEDRDAEIHFMRGALFAALSHP